MNKQTELAQWPRSWGEVGKQKVIRQACQRTVTSMSRMASAVFQLIESALTGGERTPLVEHTGVVFWGCEWGRKRRIGEEGRDGGPFKPLKRGQV